MLRGVVSCLQAWGRVEGLPSDFSEHSHAEDKLANSI
jgi:hypothetical protein